MGHTLTIALAGGLLLGLGGGVVAGCAADSIGGAETKSRNKKTSRGGDDEAALAKLTEKFDECSETGKTWLPELDLGSSLRRVLGLAKTSTDDDDDDGEIGADAETGTPVKEDGTGGSCGKPLVKWCCTLDEIKARFTGGPEALDAKFKPNTDTGYQIYACSQESKEAVKAHLIKRDDGETTYVSVTIRGLLDSGAASGSGSAAGACVADFAAILAGETASAAPVAVKDAGFAAANEVLTANCNGKGCHGANATAYPKYVDNEANLKTQKASILERISSASDPMPPGGILDPADRKPLEDYLKGL